MLREDFSNLAPRKILEETAPDAMFALQEAERIAQRDKVDPRTLAAALMNQGNALYSLGRLPEALACYDEAMTLYRQLVEREGRSELSNDLAMALMNQGNALYSLGRLPGALARYDEAITLCRQLVEREGHRELTNTLAGVLMNQGTALGSLGRLPEALARHDEAITLYWRLVEREGRSELTNELAMALMNQGNALYSLGRLPEAVAHYDEAITLCRQLVEDEGRSELSNDLAKALMNQGVALRSLGRLPEAVARYDEAIVLGERDFAAGMTQFTPDLVKCLRNRFDTHRQLGQWGAAAGDVVRALELTLPFLEGDGLAELVRREFVGLVGRLRALPQEERVQLYDELGEVAEVVRGLVEQGEA